MSLKIWNGLGEVCRASEIELLDHYATDGFVLNIVDKTKYYAFKDNGSNVLAVAHMDTVRPTYRNFKFDRKRRRVTSISLDDRLGVFIITKILPMFDVTPDILLTTDEEIGASTALYFNPDKKYNWIFSFDRRGDDVVMYDYHTTELEEMLEDNGFRVSWGTFSDICYLDHLGVSGFNFGTGYYHEHSKGCFALLDVVANMVAKFIEFYARFSEVKFTHVPQPASKDAWSWISRSPYRSEEEYDEGEYDYDYDYFIDDEGLRITAFDDAMDFEDAHAAMGHMVDFYPVNDHTGCIDCYDCDKQIFFDLQDYYWSVSNEDYREF